MQDVIEQAAERILKTPLRIAAAGRTDAGVHALGQTFHADVPDTCRMNADAWVAALNAHLPASIRIMEAREAPAGFHARFSAVGKIYEYRIWRGAVLPPHMAGRAWHRPHHVELQSLRAALHLYEGEHDFRRLSARRGNEPQPAPPDYYHRTIYSATLSEQGQELLLRFHGDGFMYRMVRMLVGTAYRVASGRMTLQELRDFLLEAEGETTRFCAPAEGLYLLRVEY